MATHNNMNNDDLRSLLGKVILHFLYDLVHVFNHNSVKQNKSFSKIDSIFKSFTVPTYMANIIHL